MFNFPLKRTLIEIQNENECVRYFFGQFCELYASLFFTFSNMKNLSDPNIHFPQESLKNISSKVILFNQKNIGTHQLCKVSSSVHIICGPLSESSVVDPDPNGIRIQQLCRS